MRIAFVHALAELAKRDPRILLLTGDLGYMALEPFGEKFPDRFFNVGVAEQNMVGLATGLAEAGFIPYVYSIVTFATLRPYEFIRNGPVLQNLPVRIVGVGGGFEYGTNGPTHYGLEDVGVLRVQPGLRVIAPADHAQTRTAVLKTWDLPGPTYYRLGKDDKTTIPGLDGKFELGSIQVVRDGSDLIMLSMGGIAVEAIAAAEALSNRGVSTAVGVVASVNPPPYEDLARILSRFPVALSAEAHYVCGGLGSLISEVIAEAGLRCRLVRCGVRTTPNGECGSQAYMQHRYGISREVLAEAGLNALAESKSGLLRS